MNKNENKIDGRGTSLEVLEIITQMRRTEKGRLRLTLAPTKSEQRKIAKLAYEIAEHHIVLYWNDYIVPNLEEIKISKTFKKLILDKTTLNANDFKTVFKLWKIGGRKITFDLARRYCENIDNYTIENQLYECM